MASFMDKLRSVTGFENEDPEDLDEYGEEDFDEYEDEDAYVPAQRPAKPEPVAAAPAARRGGNVVDIPTKTTLQVVLAKPERFDDASAIADHLNEKRTVVLNLESCSRDVARRLIDFLSGVAYANAGQLKRVANSTFIITPYNVSVSGDLLDELESNGMFFQQEK